MFEAELDGNPFSYLLTARLICEGAPTDEIIGFICFWLVFEELRVMDLAVKPLARRQGVASELIRRMLTIGRERGAHRAMLEFRASNTAARGLYERFGFRQTSIRARYYGNPIEDAVLMERPVEEM
jgi:ribosomal-protein-alanine N-acetyltransferase